ncbi:hypothetical protein KUTeg_012813 [Tegillarca granosa]|uniref:Uncharacterized protein n=1 Tax=Tegillarca granosa TaxID=220873 RepID=A0ABQ9EWR7_TEGGR|nr:hypothetical protein KUTeg_012813 [Tegillarca granosa]
MPDNKLLLPLYGSNNLAVVNANGDPIKQINVNPRMFDVTVLDSTQWCRHTEIIARNCPLSTLKH